jgi:hypothetical protein
LKNASCYQEECFTLAELLGQIAQRLPTRQEEEEEDDSDEEDAQVPPQMQGNHQPYAAALAQHVQHMPPPQMQGNHQPYAALVQRQMLPAQVQGNHVYQP